LSPFEYSDKLLCIEKADIVMDLFLLMVMLFWKTDRYQKTQQFSL